MYRVAVARLQPGDVGPHILDPERQQQTPCGDLVGRRNGACLELARSGFLHDQRMYLEMELLLADPGDPLHVCIYQFGSESAGLVPAARAKIEGQDIGKSEIPVDSARFPIAWIARVEEHDAVTEAPQPDGSTQSRRSAADDRRIVDVV